MSYSPDASSLHSHQAVNPPSRGPNSGYLLSNNFCRGIIVKVDIDPGDKGVHVLIFRDFVEI